MLWMRKWRSQISCCIPGMARCFTLTAVYKVLQFLLFVAVVVVIYKDQPTPPLRTVRQASSGSTNVTSKNSVTRMTVKNNQKEHHSKAKPPGKGAVRAKPTTHPSLKDKAFFSRLKQIDKFLSSYNESCKAILASRNRKNDCPCVPAGLDGSKNISTGGTEEAKKRTAHLVGGYWKPRDCDAISTVAVIVPFRDRWQHLEVFLKYMHPLLQHQMLAYRIFLIEQVFPEMFNKASLMNAGFMETRKTFRADCVIFHDVDTIAEDERNFYSCLHTPRHVASHIDRHKYSLSLRIMFGGATLFTPSEFKKVNGFSNSFHGWGGEDIDMYHRLRRNGIKFYRYPGSVARYTTLKHVRDKRNPVNKRWGKQINRNKKKKLSTDGMNRVKYAVDSVTSLPQYTLYKVRLLV